MDLAIYIQTPVMENPEMLKAIGAHHNLLRLHHTVLHFEVDRITLEVKLRHRRLFKDRKPLMVAVQKRLDNLFRELGAIRTRNTDLNQRKIGAVVCF